MRTTSLVAALLAAAALPVSAQTPTPEAAQQGTGAGINPAAMDTAAKPGDDFYGYANGTWQKQAQIPADRSSTGAGLVAFESTEREQTELLAKLLASTPAPGSDEARIKDYYSAYMNLGAIDAAGMAPLKSDLARYAAIKSKAQLVHVLGDQTESDLDLFNNNNDMDTENLFGLFITKSLSGPDVVPYIYQGGLGLPDREYYLSTDPKMATARTQYRTYIVQLLKAAGVSEPEARAARIFDLETKIARAHPPKADMADFTKGGTLWKRANFAKNAPGMDWNAYFTAARMPHQQVFDVYAPGAIKGMAALVGSQPLQAWKDWLIFHRINANTDVLPQKLDALHFAFYGTQLSGTPQQRPRAKRALAAINTDLGNAFGKLYVQAYFPPSAKAQVEDMVVHIKAAFAKRIAALDWMAPETKKQALAKLDATVVSVGYPNHWLDYSMVTIAPNTAYANRMSAIRGKTLQQLAKLGKPQDRSEWWMDPQLVNAVNLPVQNALNFPAAILQKPFFDPAADAAFNYGAIGAVIGHEISHSFDASGAMVDAEGNVRNWWTKADLAHFQAETQALVRQYDAYAPFPDLHLNGKLELGENGADVAGLAAAFDAYRASLNGQDLPEKDGLTGDQRFFVAFAQSWSSKTREAAERAQIVANAHAPSEYRALTVRNNDAWYKAFDVQPGAALYLDPAKRVKLW
ncbi:M13 family metallopeptidase [Novosphingobium sp. 9]|uniref:M13 family metallopeptidase n=1 Tax=Novosphingobium sp. 9 TaxID=2025349 RepID=UPI0021B632E4|nr:M13 family metallopeptidase [Novosphingobium sp. 9]